jgi:hypothetical protein
VRSSNKRTTKTHERKTKGGQETARTDTVTEVLQANQPPLDPKVSKEKLRERGEARDKDEDEGAAHLSRETADTVGNLATLLETASAGKTRQQAQSSSRTQTN